MAFRKNKYSETLAKAKKILTDNVYTLSLNGKVYRRIIPSKFFYVHQWNWDSATHAMATVYFDEELAFDEIRSLVSGQWKNGMIPHIVFNPKEKIYFPGPNFWGTDKFGFSSGITQPPLLAISILHIYKTAKNKGKAKKFLEEMLPKLDKYHNYLKKYRDGEGSGLLTIIHPWESGTDNSPRFDKYLSEIDLKDIPKEVIQIVRKFRTDIKIGERTTRPLMEDYYRYIYLIFLYRNLGWNCRKIVADSPFAIKDTFFSSIWAASNVALSDLFMLKEDKIKAKKFRIMAEQTRRAIKESFDPKEETIALFAPIIAGGADEGQFKILMRILKDRKRFWSRFPVPSTSLDSSNFDSFRYWRGPSWPIINMLLIERLTSQNKIQKELLKKTLDLIKKKGFFECYSSQDGNPAGFPNFSWTAAIFTYLYHKYYL